MDESCESQNFDFDLPYLIKQFCQKSYLRVIGLDYYIIRPLLLDSLFYRWFFFKQIGEVGITKIKNYVCFFLKHAQFHRKFHIQFRKWDIKK